MVQRDEVLVQALAANAKTNRSVDELIISLLDKNTLARDKLDEILDLAETGNVPSPQKVVMGITDDYRNLSNPLVIKYKGNALQNTTSLQEVYNQARVAKPELYEFSQNFAAAYGSRNGIWKGRPGNGLKSWARSVEKIGGAYNDASGLTDVIGCKIVYHLIIAQNYGSILLFLL